MRRKKLFTLRSIGKGYINYYFDKDTGELSGHTKHIFNNNNILTVHNLVLQYTLTTMHKIYRVCLQQKSEIFHTHDNIYKNVPSQVQRQTRKIKTKTFFTIKHSRLSSQEKTVIER